MFHEKAHKEPPWNAPHGRCMQKGGSVIEDIMVTDTLASQLHSFLKNKTKNELIRYCVYIHNAVYLWNECLPQWLSEWEVHRYRTCWDTLWATCWHQSVTPLAAGGRWLLRKVLVKAASDINKVFWCRSVKKLLKAPAVEAAVFFLCVTQKVLF